MSIGLCQLTRELPKLPPSREMSGSKLQEKGPDVSDVVDLDLSRLFVPDALVLNAAALKSLAVKPQSNLHQLICIPSRLIYCVIILNLF